MKEIVKHFMDLINVHDKTKTVDALVRFIHGGKVAARETFFVLDCG